MKKKIITFLVTTILTFATGAYASTALPPKQTTESWPRCCSGSYAQYPPPCTAVETRAQCYQSCQRNCGPADSMAGKKCRIACNTWKDY